MNKQVFAHCYGTNDNGGSQQFNGREGETATLFGRRSLNPKLRVIGFAPRHLSRSTLSGKMMRFSIPPKLIPKLRELQAQSREFYVDKIAESEDAVIMTLGLGDAMYLALDGRVIVDEFSWTTEEEKLPREAKDAKEMFTAIVVGAKRRNAPELLSLLPSRPETAVDCAACECRGWKQLGTDADGNPNEIVCWECGGIGWTDNNLK